MNNTRLKALSICFFFLLAILLQANAHIGAAEFITVVLCGFFVPLYLSKDLKELTIKGFGFKRFEKDFEKDFKSYVDAQVRQSLATANDQLTAYLASGDQKISALVREKLRSVTHDAESLQQQVESLKHEVCSLAAQQSVPSAILFGQRQQCAHCCSFRLYQDEFGLRCRDCCEYVEQNSWSFC